MNEEMANHKLARHIDSFQKLQFLLFLGKHPDMKASCREFGEHLYFGPTPLMDQIIGQLHSAGLVERVENCYQLCREPEILAGLQHLAGAFENPLTRQQMLDQVRPSDPYRQNEALYLAYLPV